MAASLGGRFLTTNLDQFRFLGYEFLPLSIFDYLRFSCFEIQDRFPLLIEAACCSAAATRSASNGLDKMAHRSDLNFFR